MNERNQLRQSWQRQMWQKKMKESKQWLANYKQGRKWRIQEENWTTGNERCKKAMEGESGAEI